MNRKMKIQTVLWSKLMIVGMAIGTLMSCDNSLERLTNNEYPDSGNQAQTGHVLCIVIDGASGKAVNEAYITQKAPHIRSMRDYAVITFEGLADSRHKALPVFTNERGWANLMTGVTNHGIGLIDEPDGEATPIEELEVPSFLNRIKQTDKEKKISLYTSDNRFYQAFHNDADIARVIDNDQNVKDALITELESDTNTPSDVILVEFSSVQEAGVMNGFYDDSGNPTASVVDAIQKIDSYVGEIRSTLESRENYRKENWLIVITSTYGGTYPETVQTDSYYDDPRLNTFTLMYNYQFVSKVVGKPGASELNYKYFTPSYIGDNQKGFAKVADPGLFEMENDKSYTVQFMYYSSTKRNNWVNILSKSDRHKGGKGWNVHGDGGRVKFCVGNRHVWTSQQSEDPYVSSDGKWHTVTLVFDREAVRFRAYIDGNYSTHRDQQNMTMPTDLTCPDYPLTIGKIENSPNESAAGFSVTNLQFYDVALPEDFIKKNHGVTKLEEVKNEYWDHLIGYWPCDREEDLENPVLRDLSQYAESRSGKSNITFEDNTWITGNSAEENLAPAPDDSYYQAVFNNVDIPLQTMQWLGLSVSEWNFEGVGKTFKYIFMEEN